MPTPSWIGLEVCLWVIGAASSPIVVRLSEKLSNLNDVGDIKGEARQGTRALQKCLGRVVSPYVRRISGEQAVWKCSFKGHYENFQGGDRCRWRKKRLLELEL